MVQGFTIKNVEEALKNKRIAKHMMNYIAPTAQTKSQAKSALMAIKAVTQQTLAQAVSCSGVGVHSGAAVQMTLHPAPENHGIVFRRVDVTDKNNLIPAKWDAVVETTLCTVIANDDKVSVSTIEHVVAALVGCGIDNVMIDVNGGEVPIMDGSSADFIAMIDRAGVQAQNAPRKMIRVLKEVTYEEGDKIARLKPADITAYSFEIDYPDTIIGRQSHTVQMINGNFRHEIADARTFGLLEEVDHLRRMGLARGGSLDNAIVVDRHKILNPEGLRYKDEFVRHKILDAVGDLHLAGAYIVAHFEGFKAGHAMNNKVLRTLFADSDAWEYV